MLFKQKKSERKVVIKSDVKDAIISYCKMTHPDEMVLILKGKSKNSVMNIDGLVIPPFSHTSSTTIQSIPQPSRTQPTHTTVTLRVLSAILMET